MPGPHIVEKVPVRRARRGFAVIAAAFLAVIAAGACTKPEPVDEDDGWKPEPMAEAKDIKVVVTSAESKVPIGGEFVFRVRIENRGEVMARLNKPRLSHDSLTFRVRSEHFDTAWIDPYRLKEAKDGAQPDPAEIAEVPPGGAIESEIRQVAVQLGTYTFLPVYRCQSLGTSLAGEAQKIEVVPGEGGAKTLGVRLETTHGVIEAKFRGDIAFHTATSWATLVKRGFFDGVKFHRVVTGFMAQGGDPTGEGWGGPGYAIRLERHGKLPHKRGVFSMARQTAPDSAGSQFFIMFRDDPNLDRGGYATFAEMTSGADTLQKIEALGSNAPDGRSQAPREPVSIRKATLILMP